MKVLLTVYALTLAVSVFGQRTVVWKDILNAKPGDTSTVRLGSADKLSLDGDRLEVDLSKMPVGTVNEGRLYIDRKLEILDPEIIEEERVDFWLTDLHFTRPVVIRLQNRVVSIYNCVFEKGVQLWSGSLNGYTKLHGNKFKARFYLFAESGNVEVVDNEFDLDNRNNDFGEILGYGTELTKKQYFTSALDTLTIYGKKASGSPECFWVKASNLVMINNTINIRGGLNAEFQLSGGGVRIEGNRFSSDVILRGTVDNNFTFTGNSLRKGLSIIELVIPSHNQINWDSIEGHLVVPASKWVAFKNIPKDYYTGTEQLTADTYSDSSQVGYLYDGSTPGQLLSKEPFDRLMETYKFLYDGYKGKGNLESSNACVVAAKELQGRRLAAIYHDKGGFENFFGWKLNQLMKFYSNHATEPEHALVLSIYIIIAFSVFYFFFPSEWDIESKGRLISHYREFVQKNEKGYLRPFLKLLLGLLVSFVNAITLSLNSFVTLGFGNIPTKGIARYVCIVQGFIGWFLLSIFTVALFNQVLF